LAWRNGRGTSAEILVRAGFVLNRTPLVADAPFSSYPGFDRLLVVIAGRLTLDVAGEVRTLAVGDLVTFAGEADVSVHLDAGRKAEVLNLITERGIWRATGEVHDADA
jgi:environmental stress-induced protein Ves